MEAGKNTTTAFLMMDESYKQSFGIMSQLPVFKSETLSVAQMVKNRINNSLSNTTQQGRFGVGPSCERSVY